MNISRRTAIKGIGAGIASTGIASKALASKAIASNTNAALANSIATSSVKNTDTLQVQIAHRWGKESLAAVIKNTSPHPATITNINNVAADHGRFNFEKLTHKGPLTLAAGEEVQIPFETMGTPAKPYGHFDQRLQKKLKEALAISTTNTASKITTSLNPRIV